MTHIKDKSKKQTKKSILESSQTYEGLWKFVKLYPIEFKNWEFGQVGTQSVNQQSDAEAAQLKLS